MNKTWVTLLQILLVGTMVLVVVGGVLAFFVLRENPTVLQNNTADVAVLPAVAETSQTAGWQIAPTATVPVGTTNAPALVNDDGSVAMFDVATFTPTPDAPPATATPLPTETPVPVNEPDPPAPADAPVPAVPPPPTGSISLSDPAQPATRLVVPRLALDTTVLAAPIVDDTWQVAHLTSEVGHLQGTAGVGTASNAVLAGHITLEPDGRAGPFYQIGTLEKGDLITVYHHDQPFTYQVDRMNIVKPSDVHITFPSAEPRLTLITCLNFDHDTGEYADRLAVFAHLVDNP